MAIGLEGEQVRSEPQLARLDIPSDHDAAVGAPLSDLRALLDRARAVAIAAERRVAEQTRRIAELETLSLTDELTGMFNRRGLSEMFARILRVAARDGHHGMLGYADLDGFKGINDRYGHDAGDAVLRHVADVLKANVRPDDYVARLGGDEFAILLVRALPADGLRRLGSIEQAIADHPARIGLRTVSLSASIGAAPYAPGADATAVIGAADQAMYRRKRHRRGAPDRLRLAVSNRDS